MDVQDGFIIGIYNYCDSRCETCSFTSRCRSFADRVEMEAECDPNLKAIADAPPLPQDIPPPPPRWMQELIDEMNKLASVPLSDEELEQLERRIPPEHELIVDRAMEYCDRVFHWFEACGFQSIVAPDDPRSVISWFQYSIVAKARRALTSLAEDDPEGRDWPADHDGSAKVALLAIERSHVAWLHLIENGLASFAEVEPFITDLIWLTDELDRVFPRARAFVRPAFDEPDEVAKLLAAERGR